MSDFHVENLSRERIEQADRLRRDLMRVLLQHQRDFMGLTPESTGEQTAMVVETCMVSLLVAAGCMMLSGLHDEDAAKRNTVFNYMRTCLPFAWEICLRLDDDMRKREKAGH
jgi:hypothetical protein